jgi:hypothetical protein
MTTPPTYVRDMLGGAQSLLFRGVVLLAVSLVFTIVLANMTGSGDATGRSILGWCQQVSFWLGLICVAGHVATEVLRGRKP